MNRSIPATEHKKILPNAAAQKTPIATLLWHNDETQNA